MTTRTQELMDALPTLKKMEQQAQTPKASIHLELYDLPGEELGGITLKTAGNVLALMQMLGHAMQSSEQLDAAVRGAIGFADFLKESKREEYQITEKE